MLIAKDIADACNQAMHEVYSKGHSYPRTVGPWAMKKYSQEMMWELDPIIITIEDPLSRRWHSRVNAGIATETLDVLLGLNPGFAHYPWGFYNEWRTENLEKYPYTYGERIHRDPYTGIDQWFECVKKLKYDASTRHAVIPIWRPQDQLNDFVPCNHTLHFQLTEHGLDLIVSVRSQDALRGLVLDTFTFSHVLEQMSLETELPVGRLIHIESNLHIYGSDSSPEDFSLEKWKCIPPPTSERKDGHAGLLTPTLKRKLYDTLHAIYVERSPPKVSIKDPYWKDYILFLMRNKKQEEEA